MTDTITVPFSSRTYVSLATARGIAAGRGHGGHVPGRGDGRRPIEATWRALPGFGFVPGRERLRRTSAAAQPGRGVLGAATEADGAGGERESLITDH